jgi:hypothetical protein
VLVEKLSDYVLVKVFSIELTLLHPPGKVSKAAEVTSLGRWRIAAADKVTLVDIYVRLQRAPSQLIDGFAGKF